MLAAAEWRFLLSGITPASTPSLPNPAPSWLTDKAWTQILNLSTLPKFQVAHPKLPLHGTMTSSEKEPIKLLVQQCLNSQALDITTCLAGASSRLFRANWRLQSHL